MKEYFFEAVIIKAGNFESGYIEFPFDVEKEFGKKGQVKVKTYFDGFEYRVSLVEMKTPCHIIGLNKKVLDAIHKVPGDTVKVVIIEDNETRTVETPADLAQLFAAYPAAKAVFDKLSFTHQKEYVEWITSAQKQETRDARLVKCIEMLSAGKKNPGVK